MGEIVWKQLSALCFLLSTWNCTSVVCHVHPLQLLFCYHVMYFTWESIAGICFACTNKQSIGSFCHSPVVQPGSCWELFGKKSQPAAFFWCVLFLLSAAVFLIHPNIHTVSSVKSIREVYCNFEPLMQFSMIQFLSFFKKISLFNMVSLVIYK